MITIVKRAVHNQVIPCWQKVRQHPIFIQIATTHDSSISIQFRIVEHILCDIQAYRCIIHSVHNVGSSHLGFAAKTTQLR